MAGWWLFAGGFISTTGVIVVLAAWRAAVHTDDRDVGQAGDLVDQLQRASGSREQPSLD